MGKRIEKAFGRGDKGQTSASHHDDEDPNKTPEPHICTGHFQSDFTELCRRNSMAVIPPVVLRPHRPPSPTLQPMTEEAKGRPGKKDTGKNQPPPEPEPEPVILDENGEPPPKTYMTKGKFEYFKPTVQVEMDHPDKLDTVTEVFVKGWKIDEPMMTIFKQCWPKMDRVHTISLWCTGLTDETLTLLSSFIHECVNLKTLNLDNNPVEGEGWHQLLKEESPVQHLSLRYNAISDKGAETLGNALGNTTQQNTKLLSLNLSGNRVSDLGCTHLSKGLRMNRTLLSLNMANNQISDMGAQKMGEVLSRFPLSHEEVVERRKLLTTAPDRKSASPLPGNKRSDSRDRPGSVRSSHAGQNKGKSAKAKKDGKEKDEKHDTKTKGKKESVDKGVKKAAGGSKETGSRRMSTSTGASMVADAGKTAGKKGDKGKKKGPAQPEQEPTESPEMQNPLLDQVEHLDNGVLLLKGNRSLINLNLAHNEIGEDGAKSLLLAVGYQTSLAEFHPQKNGANGLMRLSLHRNKLSRENDTLQKLQAIMVTKDPFYKPPPQTPDADQQSQAH